MKKSLFALAIAAAAAPASAQGGSAPFTIQESGRGFSQLQDAVSAIGNGQGTIVIAPGRYRQCAVQQGGQVAFVAAQPGTAEFDGVACEGKAALVLRGQGASVNGLIFENMKVPDGNGAGIRLEQGNLTVQESLFRDSQEGILTGNDEGGTIEIDHSTFSGVGYCGNDCAHSIYVGNYGRLIVKNARFERGTGGHYVKSRAARTDVIDSSFDDSGGRATNYMIDLSNGSVGTISGNAFVQGSHKENYSALIAVAAEGVAHTSAGLAISDNEASLAPGAKPTVFVADLSGDALAIGQNQLGAGISRFEKR